MVAGVNTRDESKPTDARRSGTAHNLTVTLTSTIVSECDARIRWLLEHDSMSEVDDYFNEYESTVEVGKTLSIEQLEELLVNKPTQLAQLIAERSESGK